MFILSNTTARQMLELRCAIGVTSETAETRSCSGKSIFVLDNILCRISEVDMAMYAFNASDCHDPMIEVQTIYEVLSFFGQMAARFLMLTMACRFILRDRY
ncbi:hypothetical protein KP509_29G007900 [Ceratopteris richardii]|uniref:Uncharacterized protein n=1 Tax=Ceratopteris richardii TaxID=49495 RepID=A0A8T2R657_CERRI|nr:hypothetical protein KP509_29G007900 [Ceratopteris richardii]